MVENLSVSSIEKYETCPRMWKYKYIDKEMELGSKALDIGKMVHGGIEKINNGEDIEDVTKFLKKKILINLEKDVVETFRLVRRCVNAYAESKLDGEVIASEAQYKMKLRNSKGEEIPIPFLGYIDRTLVDGIDEYKTTGEDYTQEKVDTSYQATIYSFFFLQEMGKLPDKIRYWVVNKKKILKSIDYKPQILITKRTQEDIDKAFDKTKQILEKILNEEFPVNVGTQCYWCPFRKLCPRK
jgi:CRISPR/Cas system-associated exonuclease Cas4 (RecB family)